MTALEQAYAELKLIKDKSSPEYRAAVEKWAFEWIKVNGVPK